MKKALSSCLVIIITFITLIAMATFKVDKSYEATLMDDGVKEELDKPDGTGLIFEDFDKNINIPINSTNEEKKSPDKDESKIDKASGSTVNIGRLRGLVEEQVTDLKHQKNAKEYVSLEEFNSNYVDFSSQTRSIEATVSLEDKASLVKLAKYLNINDVNEIRRAIVEGADEEELRAIWDNLKNKVPEEEYETLVEIVSKYE